MTVIKNPATKQAIQAEISAITTQVNKLLKWMQAKSWIKGSLVLSGKTHLGKEFHDLIIWGKEIEIPGDLLFSFIEEYAKDLISKRLKLEWALENPPVTAVPRTGQTRTAHCMHCNRLTGQVYHDLFLGEGESKVPIWICEECTATVQIKS